MNTKLLRERFRSPRRGTVLLFGAILLASTVFLVSLPTVSRNEMARVSPLASNSSKDNCGASGHYEVFLSFRGSDTRTVFADYVYQSLIRGGAHVFRDENNLPIGENIPFELSRAINCSDILMPIISPNYFGSKSCLWELALMKNRREIYGQSIYPIWYNVSLDDVRRLKGHVGESFRSLISGVHDAEAVSLWEEALRYVVKIKGWESLKFRHEAHLVAKIVRLVSMELGTISANFAGLGNNFTRKKRAQHYLSRKRDGSAESQYQVLLNFNDNDINFAHHLRLNLVNKGVRVFSADDPSLIGKDFDEEVYTAIKNCKIFIPIFSGQYPSCIPCLRELAQMMDQKGSGSGQKLFPIFLDVKPSDLRNVRGPFGKALEYHHANGIPNITVDGWRQTLEYTSHLTGLELDKIACGYRGSLINSAVEAVLSHLNGTTTNTELNW